jgi:hypothetical protein
VLDKAGNMPVLAYPTLPRDAGTDRFLLRPAGGIYPGSLAVQAADGARAAAFPLSWEDGAAATVLWDLDCLGRDTSLFNVDRLAAMLREQPDPWDIDLTSAAEAIASGSFSVYDIDRLPVHDVKIVTGNGTWATESPFRGPVTAGPGGQVALNGMAEGLHELFSTDGRVVRVEVGPRGPVVVQGVGSVATFPGRAGCPHSP